MYLYTVTGAVGEEGYLDLAKSGDLTGKNVYVNMTNKCPCSCVFCLRRTKQQQEGNTLWLKEGEPSVEINDLGGISLSLFLGMAMITLRLWELASLALPLVILLAAQVLLIIIFTYVIEFNIMGRDYDAAILVSGTCGFGTGATPNAMANMQAVCDQYVPSIKAYLLIPLVGSLFADFLNSLVITFFINLL